jgi:hypothetical protein
MTGDVDGARIMAKIRRSHTSMMGAIHRERTQMDHDDTLLVSGHADTISFLISAALFHDRRTNIQTEYHKAQKFKKK